MTFPNYPGKYQSEPLITPHESNSYRRENSDEEVPDPPEGVILCYSRRLFDHFVENYDGRDSGHYYGKLYTFDDTDHTIGVLGDFGIGAPTTAMLMDELVADGVETFLSIGFAGCLDDSIDVGEFVVCEKAVRDEGVSHHYVESEKYAYPSDAVLTVTKQVLTERGEPFHVGPSWTIDAIYQETRDEIERYAAEGVLTVEMEASAVFAVADYRGADAGAMFVVSDYLGSSEWEPMFHRTTEDLKRLGDLAKQILAKYVD